MAYGNWDDVVSEYEKFIDYSTRHISQNPNRSPDQSQWWLDNAVGMLEIIPAIHNDPDFTSFIPITSHMNLRLIDPISKEGIYTYCNRLGSEYRVYIAGSEEVMCSRLAVVDVLREWARKHKH